MICDGTLTPLVSIIIPVYNVEKYVGRCLDSIIHQTYSPIEVIIVNDGSEDRSIEICSKYSKEYDWIKIIFQRNQGQAAARNHGLQYAKGEFVTFVDSDDFVSEDYVEFLVNIQTKYQADVSIGGFQYIYEDSISKKTRSKQYQEILFDREEAIKRLNYTIGFGAMCWAKLYRKSLLINNPFPEGQIYEDLAVLYKIFYDSNKIVFGNKTIYYWVQRSGSTMRSQFDEKHLVALTATRNQIEFMRERLPEAIQSAKARHVAKVIELMAIALKSKESYCAYKELKNEMDFYSELLKDDRFKLSLKIRMVSIQIGYIPARLVFFTHEALKKVMY